MTTPTPAPPKNRERLEPVEKHPLATTRTLWLEPRQRVAALTADRQRVARLVLLWAAADVVDALERTEIGIHQPVVEAIVKHFAEYLTTQADPNRVADLLRELEGKG